MKEKERRKIYDVAVNRVDGVSEPATGRTFLLLKSAADTASDGTASQRLIDSATSVVDAFSEGGTPLTKEQAESIQSLAGSVGVDLKFSEASSDDEDDDEEEDDKQKSDSKSVKKADAEAEDDEAEDKKEVKKSSEQVQILDVDDFENMLRKMIGPMLSEELQKMVGGTDDDAEDIKKSAHDEDAAVEPVSSKRLKGQDTLMKTKGAPDMDEGLFEDVIFS